MVLNLARVLQRCLQNAKIIYKSLKFNTESVWAKIIKPNFFPFFLFKDTLKFVKTCEIPFYSAKFQFPNPPLLSTLFLKFNSINDLTFSTPYLIICYLLSLNLSY